MGTLASELGPHAGRIAARPRVYVDANVPVALVSFMRESLQWDVLFVMEHDDLRRARDDEHFRLARQLRRTLLTFDRDFLDDASYPDAESGGVVVLTAPQERGYLDLLKKLDRAVFRPALADAAEGLALPLEGRKVQVHVDWAGDAIPERA